MRTEDADPTLETTIAGEVLYPGDDAYDQARRVWNGAVDRRPVMIARCTSAADVAAAVSCARNSHLLVSIRGGGHSHAGFGVWDGALMIDLSPMKAISVDPARRTAVAGPGLTWAEFDAATQAHGLATTGADVSTTGIAGMTLGGGAGWLHRIAGLTCDNLLSAQVVTADGRTRRAAPDENSDLFWGLRGGGGNFGVVTSLEYRLQPVREVFGGLILHPLERGRDVLRFFQELCDSAPDELFLRAMLLLAPAAPFVPEELRGRPSLMLQAAYFGSDAEGERCLRPLREFGPPAVDLLRPLGYLDLQQAGPAIPPGLFAYARSEWLRRLDERAIDALVAGAGQISAPFTLIEIQQMGGAMSRIPAGDTAFGYRHAAHHLAILSMWPPSEAPEGRITWARALSEELRPASAGGPYVNLLMGDEGEERVRAAYGPENYARLAEIKARYDPDNVFQINHNIKPAHATGG